MSQTNPLRCPVCDAPADPTHVICEACGADLDAPAQPRGHWLSSAAETAACAGCGGTVLDAHGYCQSCGRRQNPTADRAELDLTLLGAATDYGKRHHYNQDALAIGRYDGVSVIVVCDGVSSSTFGELASLAASEAAVAAILDSLAAKNSMAVASHAGVVAGSKAAAAAGKGLEDNPPSCTYVSAVMDDKEIEVTWVGDSRAYWVSGDYAQCLTVDDSHVGRLAAHGVPEDDERYHTPYATALLAWLGSDSPELRPNTHTYVPDGPGRLIVCSDGLSCYMDDASDLVPLPAGEPVHIAAALTERARVAGGRDNISVAVAQFPPVAAEAAVEDSTVRLYPGGPT
jgi:serine/threonine protein phosphatase PrpC